MDDREHKDAIHPGLIIAVAAALMAIGIVMIASATAPLDRSMFAVPLWRSVFGRQVVFVLIGLMAAVTTRYIAAFVLARPALDDHIEAFFDVSLRRFWRASDPSLAFDDFLGHENLRHPFLLRGRRQSGKPD